MIAYPPVPPGENLRKSRWWLASFFCLQSWWLAVLSGCGSSTPDGYDPQWRYPPRTDSIVVETPTTLPTKPPEPGKMDEFLRLLPQLGGKILDPTKLPAKLQQQLTQELDEQFGTPAEPRVSGVSPEGIAQLNLDPKRLAQGSAIYRVRCADCHGLSGHGRGPSGPWNYPYARDFRSGLFKGSSSAANNGKPRIDDLHRVIRRGVPGTPMPIFDLIPDEDIQALTGYTIHLSIRGEVELRVMANLLSDDEGFSDDIPKLVRQMRDRAVQQWTAAQEPAAVILPDPANEPNPDSIRRGHQLFASTTSGASCLSCHENYGRTATYRWDVWGLPGRVANLTEPQAKWGRDAEDLARRIRHGIRPSNMPANPGLNADQIRDLVHFLQVLPYPARLPEDVRIAVDAGR